MTDEQRVAANIATMVSAIDATSLKEMTNEEFAAMDFEPWVHEAGEWTTPSNKEWADLANPHLVMVRVAWLTLYKTKAELMAMAESLVDGEDDGGFLIKTLDGLQNTSDWFKGMQAIVNSAIARLMCAGLNISDKNEAGA